jgi:hypothetical protein
LSLFAFVAGASEVLSKISLLDAANCTCVQLVGVNQKLKISKQKKLRRALDVFMGLKEQKQLQD